MRRADKKFLIRFTILFCFLWMCVVLFTSKRYTIVLNKSEEDTQRDDRVNQIEDAKFFITANEQDKHIAINIAKKNNVDDTNLYPRKKDLNINNWKVNISDSPVGMRSKRLRV